MKKRAMKKYIPKNTMYCGNCKWRHFLGTIYLHRNLKKISIIRLKNVVVQTLVNMSVGLVAVQIA